jgi:hypothetical protein
MSDLETLFGGSWWAALRLAPWTCSMCVGNEAESRADRLAGASGLARLMEFASNDSIDQIPCLRFSSWRLCGFA